MNVREPDDDAPRDPAIDVAWRELPEAAPPPALDDAIRAAAHRAVHARPAGVKARAPWPRWMTFAAAASIGVIAIGVWQMQPQDDNPVQGPASDVQLSANKAMKDAVPAPAAVPATTRGAADAPATTVMQARPASPAPATATAKREANIEVPPATPVPPASPAPPATLAASKQQAVAPPAAMQLPMQAAAPAMTETDKARNAPAAGAPAFAPPAEPAATDAGKVVTDAVTDSRMRADSARVPAMAAAPSMRGGLAKDAARSYDDYIARIRAALHDQRDDDAARELRALRAVYADADERLPQDLRAWAFRIR